MFVGNNAVRNSELLLEIGFRCCYGSSLDRRILASFVESRLGLVLRLSLLRPKGGVKKVSVRNQAYEDTVLIKPKSKFWPLDRYIKEFGDPKGARLKKLGHKIVRLQGYRGVLVPGDDGKGPWDLETRTGTRLEKDEEESVGSSGGEQETADAKFKSMRNAMRRDLSLAAVGAMNDILLACSAPEEERAKEMENRKRRKTQAKKRKKNALAASERKRKLCSFIDLDVESMDTDSDGEETIIAGVQRKTPKRFSTAIESKEPSSAAKAQAQTAKAQAQTTCDVVVVRSTGDDTPLKKGAPSKDPLLIESRLWSDFSTATDGSAFFSKVVHAPTNLHLPVLQRRNLAGRQIRILPRFAWLC